MRLRRGCTRVVLAFACALAGLAVLGAGGSGAAAAGGVSLIKIGTFDNPVYVTGSPTGGLYVVEKAGRIRVFKRGRLLSKPFLDIHTLTRTPADQGLQSVAFPRDYKQHGRFYVDFTNRHCASRGRCDEEVDEFRRSASAPNVANPASRRKVLEIDHSTGRNHYGGMLQFFTNYQLLISTGDGGCCGDPQGNALNNNVLLGKILRIDPRARGGAPYTIPADNPFVGGPGRDEIYSYGLRNPFRFSIDPTNGFLAIGDVGEDSSEEVDYVSMADARGADFGWSHYEGNTTYRSDRPAPGPLINPIFTYPHQDPLDPLHANCAITGGYVVRNSNLPSLEGRYIYADYCKGNLRSLNPAGGSILGVGDSQIGPYVDLPSGFGEDRSHHYYVVSLTGPVYRLYQG